MCIRDRSAAGESDVQGQETVMKAMSNGDYDALMVAPSSDTNLTAAIEAAQEAGIPMTYVNDKDANVDLPEVVASVSYTHLDVYKRQALSRYSTAIRQAHPFRRRTRQCLIPYTAKTSWKRKDF